MMSARTLTTMLLIHLLLAIAAAPAAAEGAFTLEDVMSAPFPSNLVASPSGEKVAWVVDDEGVRNVLVAEAPDFRGRRLTAYGEDDGQAIDDLVFTPDESRIVYVRGGAANSAGEIPNPLSDPEGAERAIHVVALAGSGDQAGQPRRLAEGASPLPTPDGKRVFFIAKGQVFAVDLDPPANETEDEDEGKPEALFKIRGTADSLVFSPDGRRLAFVSQRGTHSFIGVHDLGDGSLRYLDASLDFDSEPVFSPDGRRLAYLRIARETGRLRFSARREAHPWSIRVADVETGEARQVWRADEGPGSVYRFISADRQLFWGAGDRIVFPWEKEGWTHLYSVLAAGGTPTLLTPGEFEVQYVSFSPDGREVVYSSNQDDIDRQHVWRVPVTGGAPERLTAGQGIEWSPRRLKSGGVALLASGARRPAHAAIRGTDGTLRPLVNEVEGFPSEHFVEPRQVLFPAADGMTIHAQLFLPRDTAPPGDRRPAVIFFHGGSRRQMLLGFHHRGYYHKAYAFNQYLASCGYVVLSVNYRSGIGYGMEFREAIGYGSQGASEYRDVVGAGLYLRGRDDVDPERIGLWGGSYGGYLTALGLARASDLFAAGIDLHGVHDWRTYVRSGLSDWDHADREAALRIAFEASPMAAIDRWRSPVLLIHGDDDRNVPFSESVTLVEALRRRGVAFEQLVFPDEVHSFLVHRHWLEAYHAAADFLDRHLGTVRSRAE